MFSSRFLFKFSSLSCRIWHGATRWTVTMRLLLGSLKVELRFVSLCQKWIWNAASILDIIRRGSLHNAEFGHFTLFYCRRRQRNVPRIIMHVHRAHSYYLATLPFWIATLMSQGVQGVPQDADSYIHLHYKLNVRQISQSHLASWGLVVVGCHGYHVISNLPCTRRCHVLKVKHVHQNLMFWVTILSLKLANYF